MTRKQCFEQCLNDKQNAHLNRVAAREDAIARLAQKDKRFAEIDGLLAKLSAQIPLAAISGDTKKLEKIKMSINELNRERTEKLKEAGIDDKVYECEKCRDTGLVNGN